MARLGSLSRGDSLPRGNAVNACKHVAGPMIGALLTGVCLGTRMCANAPVCSRTISCTGGIVRRKNFKLRGGCEGLFYNRGRLSPLRNGRVVFTVPYSNRGTGDCKGDVVIATTTCNNLLGPG